MSKTLRQHSRKPGSEKALMELLPQIPYRGLIGHPSVVMHRIACDSRQVQSGDLFVALRGERVDGHDYVNAAIERGAVAILSEKTPAEIGADRKVPFIVVENTLESMGHLAAAFYDAPSKGITFVGVTGSNGKTTTTYLIERILLDAGYSTGAITTIEDRWPGHVEPARFTTPQSHELQRLLAAMRDAGVTHVASEVSSHALRLYRMVGVDAAVAAFTNLSFEHQEFHPDAEDYYQAKKRLFTEHLRKGGTACVNIDDACGRRLAEELDPGSVRVVCYGLGAGAEVRAESVRMTASGSDFTLATPASRSAVHTALLGSFNVSNVLAAVSSALALGVDLDSVLDSVRRFQGVPGRLERIDEGQDFTVLVDYAHSPDALEKVLTALREVAPRRIITLLGCGGNRSREKRAPMGKIAAELSDLVILTADNSRWENTRDIILDIQEGTKGHERKVFVEEDRGTAILEAVSRARSADLVLLSGKGHETTQTEHGASRPFDDRIESRKALRSRRDLT